MLVGCVPKRMSTICKLTAQESGRIESYLYSTHEFVYAVVAIFQNHL